MKIAIAGLPQTGKKTLFSLLSGREIINRKPGEIINGRALIRDVRVDKISALMSPDKTTYAENQFVLCPDIELGTKEYGWLQEARISDLLCVVLREFSSESVFHADGSIDAERDKENIKLELLFADLDLIDKRLHKMAQERKVKKPTALQALRRSGIGYRLGHFVNPGRVSEENRLPSMCDDGDAGSPGRISAGRREQDEQCRTKPPTVEVFTLP